MYSLHNKNSRDASLHYIAFLFYYRGFPRDSLGIPCYYKKNIKGYPSLGRIKARGSEGGKERNHKGLPKFEKLQYKSTLFFVLLTQKERVNLY